MIWNIFGLADFAVAITLGMITSPGRFQLIVPNLSSFNAGAYPDVRPLLSWCQARSCCTRCRCANCAGAAGRRRRSARRACPRPNIANRAKSALRFRVVRHFEISAPSNASAARFAFVM